MSFQFNEYDIIPALCRTCFQFLDGTDDNGIEGDIFCGGSDLDRVHIAAAEKCNCSGYMPVRDCSDLCHGLRFCASGFGQCPKYPQFADYVDEGFRHKYVIDLYAETSDRKIAESIECKYCDNEGECGTGAIKCLQKQALVNMRNIAQRIKAGK